MIILPRFVKGKECREWEVTKTATLLCVDVSAPNAKCVIRQCSRPHWAMCMWRMAEQHSSSWVQHRAEIVGRQSILTTSSREEWEQRVQYQNMYVPKCNEVPIVVDKIILLPWLPSLNLFEHNKCSLLCYWQNINYISVTQINIGPSNTSLELSYAMHGFIALQYILLLFSLCI